MSQGSLVMGQKTTLGLFTLFCPAGQAGPTAARPPQWLGRSATLHSHAIAPAGMLYDIFHEIFLKNNLELLTK
jgi:hypothetical protein